MAASSTTFPKGSGIPAGGAGHGPARGGQSNSETCTPGPGCLGVTPGNGKKATFRALMAPHIETTAQRWIDIIENPKHPHHARMIEKHVELEQEFKQTVELTGKGGFVIYGERESESADAWLKDHAPK